MSFWLNVNPAPFDVCVCVCVCVSACGCGKSYGRDTRIITSEEEMTLAARGALSWRRKRERERERNKEEEEPKEEEEESGRGGGARGGGVKRKFLSKVKSIFLFQISWLFNKLY